MERVYTIQYYIAVWIYIYILLLLYTGIHLVENISCTCYVRVQIWQTILGDAIVLSYCHAALRNLLHPNMSKDKSKWQLHCSATNTIDFEDNTTPRLVALQGHKCKCSQHFTASRCASLSAPHRSLFSAPCSWMQRSVLRKWTKSAVNPSMLPLLFTVVFSDSSLIFVVAFRASAEWYFVHHQQ